MGGRTIGISTQAPTHERIRQGHRARKKPIGTATHRDRSAVMLQVRKLREMA
jgi:hypothetical protein